MPPTPPPLPPETPRAATPPTPSDPGRLTYNVMADKVGGVINFRKNDNLFQGLCVLAFLATGAAVGWFSGGRIGAILGSIGGMVFGLVLSGFVLMIVGLFRKS